MSVESIINGILAVEQGYVNDPKDSGGETCWGITVSVARANGYTGAMRDMPKSVAYDIYYKQYVVAPGFDKLIPLSEKIAEEVIDTGVNLGQSQSGKFLQRALNALNDGGSKYNDLVVDGAIGKASVNALKTFLSQRGTNGEVVMLRALNSLQGTFYIELAERRPKDERFVYGWLLNRVVI